MLNSIIHRIYVRSNNFIILGPIIQLIKCTAEVSFENNDYESSTARKLIHL